MQPAIRRRLQQALQFSPEEEEYNRVQELNPANLRMVDVALRDPRHQDPRQQAVLHAERKQMEEAMAQQMMQASQNQFQMKLYQRLNPRIGTLQDSAAQLDPKFMSKLMLQMRQFNPEGSGYDMLTARASGMERDATGHMGSRDPNTGVLLKGRNHPTFYLTEQGERDAGYEIQKGLGGRYFSQPR